MNQCDTGRNTSFDSTALVSYAQSSSGLQVGNCHIGDYYPYWHDYNHYFYSSYPFYIDNKSKIEQAFKIVQKMMEKKIVKTLRLKGFIELVNEIATIL